MTQNKHVYAICCRPETADDAISGVSVLTTDDHALLNLEAASFSRLRENQYQPFAYGVDDGRPI